MKLARRFGLLIALAISASAVMAQAPVAPPNVASDTAALKAELKANVAVIRAQEKSAAMTRQQIQAIRAALRAKLAALHH